MISFNFDSFKFVTIIIPSDLQNYASFTVFGYFISKLIMNVMAFTIYFYPFYFPVCKLN